MRRRTFLAGASSTALLAVGWPRLSFADTHQSARIIDCHCHIFNADDLPIVGFVERVVLPSRDEFKKYETQYGNVIRFLVRYLAEWMKENAPDTEDEIAELEKFKAGQARPRSPAKIRVDDIDQIADLIDGLKDLRIRGERFTFREGIVSAYLPGVVVGLMHREAYPERFTDTGIGNRDGAFDPDHWVISEELAKKLYDEGKGPIAHYLRWGSVFTHFRHELADELTRIHGDRLKLVTPALIDYSNWLDDRADVKLASQVEVMGRIARRAGAIPVHGFAPFDPLREAIHRKAGSPGESPLALAKRAVREESFIGVKLYPPMGFLPLGNAKTLFAGDYPPHLKRIFGNAMNVALDAALADLYAWCVAEQVPVLAHAADSNGAGQGYSKRADPSHWRLVTEKFPGIRLSLAHFGDFDAGFDRPGNRNPKLSGTWEWHLAELVRVSPTSLVFADLSYLSTVLLEPADNRRREVVRMLKGIRAEFGGIAQRMLFGTDWIMFGNEAAFDTYNRKGQLADRVGDLLNSADFGDPEIDAVMYGNATSFLGLTLPPERAGNRQRLKKFYEANALDAGWLSEIAVQPGGGVVSTLR
jgi:predicted TIM-barrel fold metal-dependent hydrolase